jgi:hypothetical protein
MAQSHNKPAEAGPQGRMEIVASIAEQELERRLGPLAEKAVDTSGEVDLSKLTGAEALTFMSAFGMRVGPGISRST